MPPPHSPLLQLHLWAIRTQIDVQLLCLRDAERLVQWLRERSIEERREDREQILAHLHDLARAEEAATAALRSALAEAETIGRDESLST